MRPELPPFVADYLDAHHVMTLATHGAEGPWASAVFYASEGAALIFLSAPSTRHCRNLAEDSRCAATIQDDCKDWKQIKGIQLEGRVEQLAGEAESRARHLYGLKFPIVGAAGGMPAAIAEALARVRWFRLLPERLYFIDNSKGFGHREAFDLRPV